MKRLLSLMLAIFMAFTFMSCESDPEPIPKSKIQFDLDANYGDQVKYKLSYGIDGSNTVLEFTDTAVLTTPEIDAGTYDWSLTALFNDKTIAIGSGNVETKPAETKAIPIPGSPASIIITDVPGGYATAFAVDGNAIEGTSATLWLSEGQHSISFSAALDGEERGTIAESFTVEKGKAYSSSFKFVEKEIAPKTGTISITSSGADADIQILKDGSAITATAVDGVYTLELGSYKAVAKAGNGVLGTYEKSFTIAEGVNNAIVFNGRTIKVTAVAFPVLAEGQTGKLTVTGFEPVSGNTASYWIPVGNKVDIKYAILEGEAEKYTASKEITVTEASGDITLKYNPPVGTIQITAEVKADIKIYKDGSEITPKKVEGNIYTFETGAYKAEATAKGEVQGTIEKAFTVNEGSNEALVISGKKLTVTVKDFPVVPAGMTEKLTATGFNYVEGRTASYWLPVGSKVTFEYSILKDAKVRLTGNTDVTVADNTAESIVIENATPVGRISVTASGAVADIEIFKGGEKADPFTVDGNVYTLDVGNYKAVAKATGGVKGTIEKEFTVEKGANTDLVIAGKTLKATLKDFPAAGAGMTEKFSVTGFGAEAEKAGSYWISVGSKVAFEYSILQNGAVRVTGKTDVTVTADTPEAVEIVNSIPLGTVSIKAAVVEADIEIFKEGRKVDPFTLNGNVYTLESGAYTVKAIAKSGVMGTIEKGLEVKAGNNSDFVVEGKIINVSTNGFPELGDTLTEKLTATGFEPVAAKTATYWVPEGKDITFKYEIFEGRLAIFSGEQTITVKSDTGDVILQFIPTIKITSNAPCYDVVLTRNNGTLEGEPVTVEPVDNVWRLPAGTYKVRIDVKEDGKVIASTTRECSVFNTKNPDVVIDGKKVKLTYTDTPAYTNSTLEIKRNDSIIDDHKYENTASVEQWLWYGEYDVAYTVSKGGKVVSLMTQTIKVNDKSDSAITVPYEVVAPPEKVSFSIGQMGNGYDVELQVLKDGKVIATPELYYGSDFCWRSDFDIQSGKYIFKVSAKNEGGNGVVYNSGAIEKPVEISESNKSVDIKVLNVKVTMPDDGLTHHWSIGGHEPTADAYRWYIMEPDNPVAFEYKGMEGDKLRYDVTKNIMPSELDKGGSTNQWGELKATAPAVNMDAKLNLTVNGADAYDLTFKDRNGKVVVAQKDGLGIVLPSDKYTMTINPKVGDVVYVGSDLEIDLDGAKETAVEVSGALCDISIKNTPAMTEGYVQTLKIGSFDPIAANEAHIWLADGSYDVSYEARHNGMIVGTATGKLVVSGTVAKTADFDYSANTDSGMLKLDVRESKNHEVVIKSNGVVVDVKPEADGSYKLVNGDYEVTVTAKDGGRVIGSSTKTVKIAGAEATLVFDNSIFTFTVKGLPSYAATAYTVKSVVDGNTVDEKFCASYIYWLDNSKVHSVSMKFSEGSDIVGSTSVCNVSATSANKNFELEYTPNTRIAILHIFGSDNNRVSWTYADGRECAVENLGSGKFKVPAGTVIATFEALDKGGNVIGSMTGKKGGTGEVDLIFRGETIHVSIKGAPSMTAGWTQKLSVGNDIREGVSEADFWVETSAHDVHYKVMENDKVRADMNKTINVASDKSKTFVFDYEPIPIYGKLNVAVPGIDRTADISVFDSKSAEVATGKSGNDIQLAIGTYTVKAKLAGVVGEMVKENVVITEGGKIPVSFPGRIAKVEITGIPTDKTYSSTIAVAGQPDVEANSATYWLTDGVYDVVYTAKDGAAVATVLTGQLNVGAGINELSLHWSGDKAEGTLKVNADAASTKIEISQNGTVVSVEPVDGVYILPIGSYDVKVSAMDGQAVIGEETHTVKIDKGKQTVLTIDRKMVTVSITGIPTEVTLVHALSIKGVVDSVPSSSVKKWLPYGTYNVSYSGSRNGVEEGYAEETITVGKDSASEVNLAFKPCYRVEESSQGGYLLAGVDPRVLDEKGHVTIPKNILGYDVIEIASNAFDAVRNNVVSIDWSTDAVLWVKRIEGGTFANMPNLKWVRIPGRISTLKNGAFTGSPNLRSLHIDAKREGKIVTLEEGWKDTTTDVTIIYDRDWEVSSVDAPDYSKELLLSLKLVRGSGYTGVFQYPDYWEDKPVQHLAGTNAGLSVSGIELPENLLVLGFEALNSVSSKTFTEPLVLPSTLKEIGGSCIQNLNLPESQKYLVIPESVVNVGYGIFKACTFDIQVSKVQYEKLGWQWLQEFKGNVYDKDGKLIESYK